MAYLDEDGYVVACDMCGIRMDFHHKTPCPHKFDSFHRGDCTCGSNDAYARELIEIQRGLWSEFFLLDGRRLGHNFPAEFPEDTCRNCALRLTPAVQRFADIWLVNIFNNRLLRTINEKRKQQ